MWPLGSKLMLMRAFNHSSPIQYNQGYLALLMLFFNVITQVSGLRMDQDLTVLINIWLKVCNMKLWKHNKSPFNESYE